MQCDCRDKNYISGNVKDFFKQSVNIEKYFQKVRNAEIRYNFLKKTLFKKKCKC